MQKEIECGTEQFQVVYNSNDKEVSGLWLAMITENTVTNWYIQG